MKRTGFRATVVKEDGPVLTIESENLKDVKRFFKHAGWNNLLTLEITVGMTNDDVRTYLKGARSGK